MVLDVVTTGKSENEEDDEYDVVSVDSDAQSYDKSVEVFEETIQPSFGNIAVNNSTDVHFGNKTYYQGPVTIKQILYSNAQKDSIKFPLDKDENVEGKDNGAYLSDTQDSKATADDKKAEGDGKDVLPNKKWNPILNHKRVFIITALVTIFLVSIIVTLSVFVTKHLKNGTNAEFVKDSDEQDLGGVPVDPINDPTVKLTLSGKLKIISRLEWVAQPATKPPTPLKNPVPYVIIQHTATEYCDSQSKCTFHVRYIQSYHIDSRGWWDIGYNFLVGGDGFAYEGRGWTSEGAHTYGYNSKSIGIAFIGTFNTILPPLRQIVAAQQLIKKGVENGYIAEDYKLLAALQVSSTQSPGKMLYENMKNWTHWAESP